MVNIDPSGESWFSKFVSILFSAVGVAVGILTGGAFGFVGYWDDTTGDWQVYAGGWATIGTTPAGGFINFGSKNGEFSFYGGFNFSPQSKETKKPELMEASPLTVTETPTWSDDDNAIASTDPYFGFYQEEKTIDNTKEAFYHYFNGKGVPVKLGPKTINTLINSKDFRYRHNRIISGRTKKMIGNFSVDLTLSVFHVGQTNVNYSIKCFSGNCSVSYDLFVNDGFWDVDFIDEKVLGGWLGIKRFQPDGLGPNLERFGGTPYPYIPSRVIYTFPNPGY